MSLYEVYQCPCPECGGENARDTGPYPAEEQEWECDPDFKHVHFMRCTRCGTGFDAGPSWLRRKREAIWRAQGVS